MVIAFLLAGGRSTRMNPLNLVTEKSLLPIIGKSSARIIVEKLLDCQEDIELEQIVICVHKKHMEDWEWEFRDLLSQTTFDIATKTKQSIIKFHALDGSIGTAGHLLLASTDLAIDETKDILIQYADSLTDMVYQEFLDKWKNTQYPDRGKPAKAAIVVTTKARYPYSIIQTVSANGSDKFLSTFEEKPYLLLPTWIGIAAINMGVLRNFVYNDLQIQNTNGLDFGRDIWGRMGQRYAVFVYENNDNEWHDIGTVHGYLAVREELKLKQNKVE